MSNNRIARIERGALFVIVEAVALSVAVVVSSFGLPSVGLLLGLVGFGAGIGAALSV